MTEETGMEALPLAPPTSEKAKLYYSLCCLDIEHPGIGTL